MVTLEMVFDDGTKMQQAADSVQAAKQVVLGTGWVFSATISQGSRVLSTYTPDGGWVDLLPEE